MHYLHLLDDLLALSGSHSAGYVQASALQTSDVSRNYILGPGESFWFTIVECFESFCEFLSIQSSSASERSETNVLSVIYSFSIFVSSE